MANVVIAMSAVMFYFSYETGKIAWNSMADPSTIDKMVVSHTPLGRNADDSLEAGIGQVDDTFLTVRCRAHTPSP